MSSLCGKVETEVEIKCTAQQFFELHCDRPQQITNAVTESFLEPCTLVEGEFGKVGSIIIFNLVHDGQPMPLKEEIKEIDRNNYSMSYKVIDGIVLKEFKSFVSRFDARSKSGGGGGIVHWTFEFEKLHDGIADPQNLLDDAVKFTKEIDEALVKGYL